MSEEPLNCEGHRLNFRGEDKGSSCEDGYMLERKTTSEAIDEIPSGSFTNIQEHLAIILVCGLCTSSYHLCPLYRRQHPTDN